MLLKNVMNSNKFFSLIFLLLVFSIIIISFIFADQQGEQDEAKEVSSHWVVKGKYLQTLTVSKNLINLTIEEGNNLDSQTFEVVNSGGGNLQYSITVNKDWLSVSPESGMLSNTSDTVNISFDIDELSVGSYTGLITVEAIKANESPQIICVNLTVDKPLLPEISIQLSGQDIINNSDTVDFGSIVRDAASISKTFIVSNVGTADLELSNLSVPAGYFIFEGLSAIIAEGNSDSFTVSLETETVGLKQGDIQFDTNDSEENPFVINVFGDVLIPATLTASTANLIRIITEGDQATSQTIILRNVGEVPLNYDISSNQAWISVEPETGTIDSQEVSIVVNYDTTSLTFGTYTGQITIVSEEAVNSPLFIDVELIVEELIQPDVFVTLSNDEVISNISSVDFGSVIQGGASPTLTFDVGNNGNGTLELYTVTVPEGFVVTENLNTSIEPNELTTFTVQLSTDLAGEFRGQLQFNSDDPDEVPFSFEITGMIEPLDAPIFFANPAMTNQGVTEIFGSAYPNAGIKITNGLLAYNTTANSSGEFSINIPLTSNKVNRIFASSSLGSVTSASSLVEVIQDSKPPALFIDFPLDGTELTNESIIPAGRVSDMLTGFTGLSVEVDSSIPAIVDVGIGTNGTFESSSPVNLMMGENIITVDATDNLGNTVQKQIIVTRVPLSGIQMTSIVPSDLEEPIRTELSEPLGVRITQDDGSTPIVNKLVTFEVIKSDGRLAETQGSSNDGSLILQTRTDSDGNAQVWWRMGSDAGCGNNRVQVTSRDVNGTVYFCASATPGPASQINIGSGNNQRVESGAILPDPFEVWVNDGCNGIEGVDVLFSVKTGTGSFVNGSEKGLSEVTVTTGQTGHASVSFRAGVNGEFNSISADFDANAGASAIFNSLGVSRTRQPTEFEGLVYDNGLRPIGGAGIEFHFSDQTSTETVTDSNGYFKFTGIPSGPVELEIFGTPANLLAGNSIPLGSFPSLHFEPVLVNGALNSMGEPILLPELNPENRVLYDGTQDIELTIAGIEGLTMYVAAGSMTLADGTIPTSENPVNLALNQVHTDDIPMPMPNGTASPFAWTLKPAEATFDPPIRVEAPNMAGLPPGAVGYFLTFNHDTGAFEIFASGEVSNDGSTVSTDPGAGLEVSGWGGICPPYPEPLNVVQYKVDAFIHPLAARGASKDERFNFWVNDDDDYDEKGGDNNQLFGFDNEPPILPDYENNRLDSLRGLEDLLPIVVQIPSETIELAEENGLSLTHSFTGIGEARLYKVFTSTDNIFTDINLAEVQTSNSSREVFNGSIIYSASIPEGTNLIEYMSFPDLYINEAEFFIEFTKSGNVDLNLNLSDSDETFDDIFLKFRSFNQIELYDQIYATPTKPNDTPIEDPVRASHEPLETSDFGWVNLSPSKFPREDSNNFTIFVHGYNYEVIVDDPAYRIGAATTFKRLWWAGYRGHYSAFRWPSLPSFPNTIDFETFNESEYRALYYANSLKEYLDLLNTQYDTIHLAGHSQGGMVSSESIRLGAEVDTLLLLQAAVSASAYDLSTNLWVEKFVAREALSRTWDIQNRLSVLNTIDAGYYGMFSKLDTQSGVNIVNFNNKKDLALLIWDGNNFVTPSTPLYLGSWYNYNSILPIGERYTYFLGDITNNIPVFTRTVVDYNESRSFIARSPSYAVGTEDRTRGSVRSSYNLTKELGFTSNISDHTGQINRHFQHLWPYYQRMLHEMKIDAFDSTTKEEVVSLKQGNWSVQLPGTSVQVDSSGSFELSNVQISNAPARITGTSSNGLYYSTPFFDISQPGTVTAPEGEVRNTPFPTPVNLDLGVTSKENSTFLQTGDIIQLSVSGNMSDGTVQSLQTLSEGTVYTSSNSDVLLVNQEGEVTAVSDGGAFITVSNQGTISVIGFEVRDLLRDITISGIVLDDDGNVVNNAIVTEVNSGFSAISNSSGVFEITGTSPPIDTSNLRFFIQYETSGFWVSIHDGSEEEFIDVGFLQQLPKSFTTTFFGSVSSTDCELTTNTVVFLDEDNRTFVNEDYTFELVANITPEVGIPSPVFIKANHNEGENENGVASKTLPIPDGVIDVGEIELTKKQGSIFPEPYYRESEVHSQGNFDLVDYNNDGYIDIVTANDFINSISAYEGIGDGTFQSPITTEIGFRPYSLAAKDFNGDNIYDLVTVNAIEDSISIFFGDGAGNFELHTIKDTIESPNSVQAIDLNDDGILEIITARDGRSILRIHSSDFQLSYDTHIDLQLDGGVSQLHTGDFNNDSIKDLAVSRNLILEIFYGKKEIVSTDSIMTSIGIPYRSASVMLANSDKADDIITIALDSENMRLAVGDNEVIQLTTQDIPGGEGRKLGLVTGNFDGENFDDIITFQSSDFVERLFIANSNIDGTFSIPEELPIDLDLLYSKSSDLNNDGLDDIVSGESEFSILLAHQDEVFSSPTLINSTRSRFNRMVVCDINRDSVDDIIATNGQRPSGSVIPFLGNADGSFTEMTELSTVGEVREMAYGDLDNDGYIDIVAADTISQSSVIRMVSILYGNAAGLLDEPVVFNPEARPTDVAIADLDGDSFDDLIISAFNPDSIIILYGNAERIQNNPVTLSTGRFPHGIDTTDLNGDGILDITTAVRFQDQISVYESNSDRGYNSSIDFDVAQSNPDGILFANMNNDSYLDIIIYSTSNFSVFLGGINSQFTEASVQDAVKINNVAKGDMDLDGNMDLLLLGQNNHYITIMHGDGAGDFTRRSYFRVGDAFDALAVWDFDKDGDLDFAVGEDFIKVFKNDTIY